MRFLIVVICGVTVVSLEFSLTDPVAAAPANQEQPASQKQPAEPTYGLDVGQRMRFHVVDFTGGARTDGAGCPSVMISNARKRGIEIWARAGGESEFQLAKSIDAVTPAHRYPLSYLIVFDKSAQPMLTKSASDHSLQRLQVAIPRSMKPSVLGNVESTQDPHVVVFFMDRKRIVRRHVFAENELDSAAIEKLASEAKQFWLDSNQD